MAGVALALAVFAYVNYIYMLGFPDGFISELGRAQRRLAYLFIGISLVLSAGFISMGVVALQKKIAKTLFVAIIFYLVTVISVLLVDSYYRSNLIGSGGG